MGKAFESEVLRETSENDPIHQLSKMHIIDENRHTAISNLFSKCSSSYLPKKDHSVVTSFIFKYFQNAVVRSSFSESYTKRIEFNLAYSLLEQNKLFSKYTDQELYSFCKEHYDQITGIEEIKNTQIPSKNFYMLNNSELSEQQKIDWKLTMEENSGFIDFFPKKKSAA